MDHSSPEKSHSLPGPVPAKKDPLSFVSASSPLSVGSGGGNTHKLSNLPLIMKSAPSTEAPPNPIQAGVLIKTQSGSLEQLNALSGKNHDIKLYFASKVIPSLLLALRIVLGMIPVSNVGRKRKHPVKPGKHICKYCGRACAKPSVLEKHIRMHTDERPYPCDICALRFRTKSNLYKHRKSYTHTSKLKERVSRSPLRLLNFTLAAS